jgi:hypothetical protein
MNTAVRCFPLAAARTDGSDWQATLEIQLK